MSYSTAIFFTILGLVIGSFLNVCIDRLPARHRFYFRDKDNWLRIDITKLKPDSGWLNDIKGKTVFVTGKVIKDFVTGKPQIYVDNASQIVIKEENTPPVESISWKDAKDKIGTVVTASGEVNDGETVRQSLASPPSHCDSCNRKLSIMDNIPIFSYLLLGGKCRYCKARIPIRVLLVELLTGVLFLVTYLRFGLTAQFGITAFWISVFILIIFIDWEHQLILNVITYPMVILAVVLLAIDSFVPGANLFGGRIFFPHTSLYSGLFSGGFLLLVFLLIAVIRPGTMGIGDAKLVTLIGLVSGFPLVIFSMLIGIVIGGVVAIILLVTKKKSRKDVIPYGTFLAIGPIIAMLLPGGVMDWYLSTGR